MNRSSIVTACALIVCALIVCVLLVACDGEFDLDGDDRVDIVITVDADFAEINNGIQITDLSRTFPDCQIRATEFVFRLVPTNQAIDNHILTYNGSCFAVPSSTFNQTLDPGEYDVDQIVTDVTGRTASREWRRTVTSTITDGG